MCHFSPPHSMVSKYSVYFSSSRQVWWQKSPAGFLQQELNKTNVTFAILVLAPSAPNA